MYVIYAYLFGGKGWCLFRWELLAFGFILEDGDVCESNVWPRFVALSIALRPERVADYPANTAAGLPSHEGSKLVESWVEKVGRLEAYIDHPKYLDPSMA